MVDLRGLRSIMQTKEALDAFVARIPDIGRLILLVRNVVQQDAVKRIKALVLKGLPQQVGALRDSLCLCLCVCVCLSLSLPPSPPLSDLLHSPCWLK